MDLPAAPEPGAPCPELGAACPWLEAMRETPQNPAYHGEGDVLAHTQMVAASSSRDPDCQALDAGTGRSCGSPPCCTTWASPRRPAEPGP